ncbi:alpha/beta-Hydrolases superfamily protein [Raphanus sativus]|uniref:GDSL esterase/lipase At4g10955 n=1 Tax=Raphanus sativus TaxID=3726 RepID=A0A6J0LAW5_RAPSA|nr:GDSL esterase/lipase At4g10955 [Raphanus sativus]KAJ4875887.1 alpha/beta-Hydrolases superfamily protein [Raphanus sativus]
MLMANCASVEEEMTESESGVATTPTTPKTVVVKEDDADHHHPYAFHVSGPRNVASPNWRDLINSSWKDPNYKRTVMACFIQAAYLLELDRQENRDDQNALAPKWWIPFKYKLTQTLIDERDGSIFGALLEWDRSAAMADLVVIRPSGAPKAVLALRGTILKSLTMRRDIQDDLRFLAWESLKGSVRFNVALQALESVAKRYGSGNVCVVGHSLGAGFALQVGKALAKDGLFVDAHLFNPPSISLAMSLRNIGEKAGVAWKRLMSMLPPRNEHGNEEAEAAPGSVSGGFRNWVPSFYGQNQKSSVDLRKWVPHLYVNDSDYICCYYTDQDGVDNDKENKSPVVNTIPQAAAKLFVMSKGKQKFLEAHGLEQWWSENLELQSAIHSSRLITQQLKSLYSVK